MTARAAARPVCPVSPARPSAGTLFVFLLGCLAVCGCGGGSDPAPGAAAPDFTLARIGGGPPVTLSAYRGKPVVLSFWSSWCGPCREEMPSLVRLASSLKEKGVEVIGIGIDDDPDALGAYATSEGVSFPVVFDRGARVKRTYRVRGVPETFFVGRDGTFRLFEDAGGPVVKVFGPRDWDDPSVRARLAKALDLGR